MLDEGMAQRFTVLDEVQCISELRCSSEANGIGRWDHVRGVWSYEDASWRFR